ncbi:circadian clock-controlled protein daywake isoform X2 [Drosophila willistoni]|uniref:circadian clock-controlled protein daywake isoform X2 n=1 Tax=Drosophila willistoni TaxID=7260 RepID=UPI000C26D407|nr:circadian clock-controlled protein daywake isoform X2 [Drosophila willistoni]
MMRLIGLAWATAVCWLLGAVDIVESVAYFTEKPSYIESCRIYEPEFTKCLTRSTQKFMNEVINGIPELLESFGPMDPMRQDQLTFKQANSDVATISANLTELLIRGFGNMVIKESNLQDKIYLPQMRLDGKYKMVGHILRVPLRGAGKIYIEIDDLNILVNVKTRLYEKGGFTFYNVTDVRVQLDVGKVRTNLENLFNGRSKEVERSTNQFFNDNWRDFFEAMRPLISETVERTLMDLLKKTFDLIPANFFVEDIPNSLELYGRKTQMIT